MGSNLFLLILLASAVWQVISTIAEKKAKEKQQEELARRRAEAQRSGRPMSGSGTDGGTRVQSPGSTSAGTDARSRAEQIAARRKAQIEELRRRAAERGRTTTAAGPGAASSSSTSAKRAAASGGGRTQMADAARRSTGSASTPAPRASSARPEIARDWDELTRRREAERASRSESRRQQDLIDAAQRRQRDVAHKARREKAARDEAASLAATSVRSAFVGLGGGAESRSVRLRALAKNREAMRDVMLLNELLQPPVGMRSNPVPADAARSM